MFVLSDPTERKTAKSTGLAGVTVAYYEADGDFAEAYYRMRTGRDGEGKPEVRVVMSEWLAPFVVDWDGVVDKSGAPIVWPAKDAPPPKIATAERPTASAADLATRRKLLGRMPFDFLQAMDALVGRAFAEGFESGKD